MKSAILFVTGSDTGVGKTVLATLLTRHLLEQGFRVAGLKPICSGGRGDALALREAAGRILTLDEVNPWHFRAATAPLLAARRERRRVRLPEVVAQVQRIARQFDVVVVEGAGGLFSPLGEGFDSRDLIRALRAAPVIVCPDRLGGVNQAMLVLAALPPKVARAAPVVLVEPSRRVVAGKGNAEVLAEFIGPNRVHSMPWLGNGARFGKTHARHVVRRILEMLARIISPSQA